MPTLKLGSTTAITEDSGALTINVANPTVTLGSNATFNAPTIGDMSNCTFPAGHMRQVYHAEHNYDFQTNTVWKGAWAGCSISGLTIGSKLLRMSSGWVYTDGAGGDTSVNMDIHFCGDSWGGGSGSTDGTEVATGICQYNDPWMTNYFCWINLSPAITATSGAFYLYADNHGGDGKRFNFQKCYHTFFEVYQ